MADTSLLENNIGLLIWKMSTHWQSKLRKILYPYRISLNEYLILQSINYLIKKKSNVFQNEISKSVGLDISVASVIFKSLESKNYISREVNIDNRKKIIKISQNGKKIFELIHPLVLNEEYLIFNKLNNETFNFKNSLKLLLGRKIRIKVAQK